MTKQHILVMTLWLLMISPVLWAGWKMWANHLYYKRRKVRQDEIMADPDPRRRIECLLATSNINPPYHP
jgi:hypothetical protein